MKVFLEQFLLNSFLSQIMEEVLSILFLRIQLHVLSGLEKHGTVYQILSNKEI